MIEIIDVVARSPVKKYKTNFMIQFHLHVFLQGRNSMNKHEIRCTKLFISQIL